jgi:hypothetical protein
MRTFVRAIERQETQRRIDRIDTAVLIERAESKDILDVRRRLLSFLWERD